MLLCSSSDLSVATTLGHSANFIGCCQKIHLLIARLPTDQWPRRALREFPRGARSPGKRESACSVSRIHLLGSLCGSIVWIHCEFNLHTEARVQRAPTSGHFKTPVCMFNATNYLISSRFVQFDHRCVPFSAKKSFSQPISLNPYLVDIALHQFPSHNKQCLLNTHFTNQPNRIINSVLPKKECYLSAWLVLQSRDLKLQNQKFALPLCVSFHLLCNQQTFLASVNKMNI